MKKKKIFIRVDIDKKIGSGHYVRCIALAEILKKYFDIYFFSTNITNSVLIDLKNNKFKFIRIKKQEDFFKKITYKSIVILDGYKFNINYQEKIKKYTKNLIVLDDRSNTNYDANYVINFSFKKNFLASKKNIFTGIEYFPIRKPFRIKKNYFQKKIKIKTAFVCFGGTDPYNLTKSTVKILTKFKIKKINVVLGEQHLNSPSDFKKDIPHEYVKLIKVYQNLSATKIKSIMMNSDFAIVPASTILIELFTIGIRVITGFYVKNQKNSLNYLIKKKLVLSCGNMLSRYENKLTKCIKKLSNNSGINFYKKQRVFTAGISSKLLDFFLQFNE